MVFPLMGSFFWNSRRLSLVMIFLAIGILLWMGIVSLRFLGSFLQESDRVEHSWMVLTSIDRLFSELQDAETGERGYIITRNPSFLSPYQSAGKKVRGHLQDLEHLVSDRPSQEKRAMELGQLIDKRLFLLGKGVALGKSGISPHPDALLMVMLRGKEVMDQIRHQTQSMKSSEYRRLRRRSLLFYRTKKKVLPLVGGGLAASVLMISLSSLFLSREIDRRVQAEQKARKYAEEVRNLYDYAPCGYHSVDREGIFLRINETELSWLGYRREELEGKKRIFELLFPEDLPLYQNAFQGMLRGEPVRDLRLRFLRKDGSVLPVLLNVSVNRDDSGKFFSTRGVLLDMTDKRIDEEKILDLNRTLSERNRQLEVTNGELEGFSYSVSHDLRAPLRSIDGFSRILQEDYAGKLDAEGERVIGVIRNNTRKMSNLIDDLLAFSRLGKKAFSWSLVDMEALIREDILPGVLSGSEKGTGVDVTLSPLPRAWGDRTLLAQVWTNLLSNAVKFSEKREKPSVRVEGRVETEEVVYTVRDNGVGFDMQYYDKLFKVFQRLHAQAEFPGTGVGLAIVQRVIARHGGRVWAESQSNEGAAFHFSLPVRDSPPV
ncbi:sensor histidine kinase [Leptospirillum ferriphilum]|uniref:histidine kinase n=2 Tax=Leptospirillum ferriphilum TaxID=178606 RepID=A0A2I2MIA6_9BACT|nr:CHASE3 domain-containing protein [Leptospirillum ferriphilum]